MCVLAHLLDLAQDRNRVLNGCKKKLTLGAAEMCF